MIPVTGLVGYVLFQHYRRMSRAALALGCSYATLVRRTHFHSRKGRSAKRRLDALNKAVLSAKVP